MKNPPVGFIAKTPANQLADELRRRIHAGETGEKLPGLRRLMADFSLSRTTVEAALEELKRTGDVIDPGPSRALKTVRRPDAKAMHGTLFVFDQPPEKRGGEPAEIFRAIEAALPPPVVRLCLDHPGHDSAQALRRIRETTQRRVVITGLRAEIADRLAEDGRVVVAVGVAGEPLVAGSVAVSYEQLVRGAVSRAFEAGHRRVSFPLWRRKPEIAAMMRGWIADEYAKAGYRHSPDFDAPIVPEDTPESLKKSLRALLRHTPPTAFVAGDFRQWLGTLSALAEAGLRTPRDVSLITLCASADWDTVSPEPTHFRFPVADIVKAVKAALAEGAHGGAPKRVRLSPIWVPGGSLGPPRKGGE